MINARRLGHRQISESENVVLSQQRLDSTDFRGRHIEQFSAEGTRLERCRFDNAVIEYASFGAGRAVSEYVDCSFDGAKLRMGPGGYARFVGCTFENTLIENWFCFAVEIVGCMFSGRLRKVVFNGTPRPEDVGVVGRRVNQFEDNDFSRATLADVSFRTGIDLAKQQLPTGDDYRLLDNAESAVRRARVAFNAWDDQDLKKQAKGVLTVMEEDVAAGQSQLLIRPDAYPRASRRAIKALLDAATNRS